MKKKLRLETIEAIKAELKPIRSAIDTYYELPILEAYEVFKGIFKDEVVEDKAEDYRLKNNCFDITTDHTETTVISIDSYLFLGTVEVWEDYEYRGDWEYEQIINNEVEFED